MYRTLPFLAISGISLSFACGCPVASLLFISSLGVPVKSMGFPVDPFFNAIYTFGI